MSSESRDLCQFEGRSLTGTWQYQELCLSSERKMFLGKKIWGKGHNFIIE